jgi:hypothetical protein
MYQEIRISGGDLLGPDGNALVQTLARAFTPRADDTAAAAAPPAEAPPPPAPPPAPPAPIDDGGLTAEAVQGHWTFSHFTDPANVIDNYMRNLAGFANVIYFFEDGMGIVLRSGHISSNSHEGFEFEWSISGNTIYAAYRGELQGRVGQFTVENEVLTALGALGLENQHGVMYHFTQPSPMLIVNLARPAEFVGIWEHHVDDFALIYTLYEDGRLANIEAFSTHEEVLYGRWGILHGKFVFFHDEWGWVDVQGNVNLMGNYLHLGFRTYSRRN